MKDITRRYSNGEITVIWKPSLCIHSAICAGGLPGVFQPRNRPWITMTAATTGQIIEQVDQCPSGALSYERGGTASEVPPATGEEED